MKYMFLVFSLLYALVLNASVQFPNDYTPVAEEKMEDYKKAVHQAFIANQLLTQACNAGWVANVVMYADDILVSQVPTKPLLIFNAFGGVNSEYMNRLVITTDSAMKKVTQVDAEAYFLEETNTGDLSNPVFTSEYVLKNHISCTIKPL